MTGQEIMDDCDRFIVSADIQVALSLNRDSVNLEKWLRFAFIKGAAAQKAQSDKLRWPDSAVESDRQHMHELGVRWP